MNTSTASSVTGEIYRNRKPTFLQWIYCEVLVIDFLQDLLSLSVIWEANLGKISDFSKKKEEKTLLNQSWIP